MSFVWKDINDNFIYNAKTPLYIVWRYIHSERYVILLRINPGDTMFKWHMLQGIT